jgi:hypothetical protein
MSSANHEVHIIQFGEQENHEALVIQYGEQCKSWISYHTIWWAVQIMKCLIIQFDEHADHEVLIIQFDEQCKSWNSYHTVWSAWKSWSSYHTVWWAWKSLNSFNSIQLAVQIMKCLIIVCFSLLFFPLSLPKYFPQHPVLKLLSIFKYSSPNT